MQLVEFKYAVLFTERISLSTSSPATIEVYYMEKNPGMFSSKNVISLPLKKEISILDDMGVSQLLKN